MTLKVDVVVIPLTLMEAGLKIGVKIGVDLKLGLVMTLLTT